MAKKNKFNPFRYANKVMKNKKGNPVGFFTRKKGVSLRKMTLGRVYTTKSGARRRIQTWVTQKVQYLPRKRR